jgi:predicted 3-demethylubiquinone-9 3-methyltransferase (glyoxalase superfamily)
VQQIVPFLWYAREAEEAVAFYVSLFPDSRIDRVVTMPSDSPSGPAGSVKVVEFTLAGRPWAAMTAAAGAEPFNHAVSLSVDCADQTEVDRCWDAIVAAGGTPVACGWIRDRWGLSWQIVPRALTEMMASPDRVAARRATDAMMTMVKLDVAALRAAFEGTAA